MLLGIDAGGTSTRALLVDVDGECRGFGSAGGGNPVSWGPDRAARSMADAVAAAFAQVVGLSSGAVAGPAVIAMAGGSGFVGASVIERALAERGVAVRVVIESDLLATFCAGTPALDGYGVVAGTGAAAIRVRAGQVERSADGLGWLLGDEGSGFWIGHQAVRAALADLDGRGPATSLTLRVLAEAGLDPDMTMGPEGRPAALQQAINALYQWRPVEMSRFARLALDAAGGLPGGLSEDSAASAADDSAVRAVDDSAARAAADPVAVSIVAGARDRLVGTLRTVWDPKRPGPVVLGGGIARRLPGLADAMRRAFGDVAVTTVVDGTVGAAVLALRHAGMTVDADVFARLTETVEVAIVRQR